MSKSFKGLTQFKKLPSPVLLNYTCFLIKAKVFAKVYWSESSSEDKDSWVFGVFLLRWLS